MPFVQTSVIIMHGFSFGITKCRFDQPNSSLSFFFLLLQVSHFRVGSGVSKSYSSIYLFNLRMRVNSTFAKTTTIIFAFVFFCIGANLFRTIRIQRNGSECLPMIPGADFSRCNCVMSMNCLQGKILGAFLRWKAVEFECQNLGAYSIVISHLSWKDSDFLYWIVGIIQKN